MVSPTQGAVGSTGALTDDASVFFVGVDGADAGGAGAANSAAVIAADSVSISGGGDAVDSTAAGVENRVRTNTWARLSDLWARSRCRGDSGAGTVDAARAPAGANAAGRAGV